MGYSNRPCARGCPPGGGGGGVQIECLDVIQISFIHQYLLYLGRPQAFGFGLSDSLSVCGCRNVMWHKMEEMGRGMVGVWYTHFTSIIGVDIITPLLYDRKHLCGPARVTNKLENKSSTHFRGFIRSGWGMLKIHNNCKLFTHSHSQKEYIDCYLLKTCNTSLPYIYERLPTRWREIWNITQQVITQLPSSSQVGRNCYYYIQYLLQYWATADKEILRTRLTSTFKMATNRWVKRKWVRNQL